MSLSVCAVHRRSAKKASLVVNHSPSNNPVVPERATTRQWLALSVLLLPVLLVSVDNTVLAFAVPQISSQLQPTGEQLLWVVDIYPLIMATLLVPMGVVADRFGRRRLLFIGSAGFAGASALAALSPHAGYLIMGRALIAVFGAMLMPSTMALIRNIFVDGKQRRLAIAIWAVSFSAGGALGPVLGGVLLNHFYWGSIFLMAVPILVVFLITAPWLLPESRNPQSNKIDLISVGLAIGAMAPMVYGITILATSPQLVRGITTIVGGVGLGLLFVLRQLRTPNPLLDLTLFANRTFRGSVVMNFFIIVALVGFLFFATQDLQLVMGLDSITAALVLVPGLMATMVAGIVVVPIVARVKPATVVFISLLLSAAGYGLVALATTTPVIIMVAFIVLGIGIGAGETVSNDLILTTAPADQSGAASAISETAYEVGAAMGAAVIGGLITASFRHQLIIPQGIRNTHGLDTLGGAVEVAHEVGGWQGAQLLTNAQQAFASSAVITAGVGALLMCLAALYAAIALRDAQA